MAKTIDCGEGKHDLCTGTGTRAWMFPQEDDPDGFACGCACHHAGPNGSPPTGRPCEECYPDGIVTHEAERRGASR